jgi:hypothetical protein
MKCPTHRQSGDSPGDAIGVEEVYAKFAHRLVGLARSQLRTQFQSRVESDARRALFIDYSTA